MINSRSLDDLHPHVKKLAESFIETCSAEEIEILIYSTYRDNIAQNALYARGRSRAGKIVTNAKGGESYHNYRLAFDFVPRIGNQLLWGDKTLYKECGAIAVSVGLEWGGNWVNFKDMPHCQYSEGLSLKDLQAGKQIKGV